MRRSKKEVADAVERIEAVACTNLGDGPRMLSLRPNDLRRLVDAIDDARDSDARQRAEIRALRKAAAGLYREVVAKFGWSACVDARLAVAEALAPKRRARK